MGNVLNVAEDESVLGSIGEPHTYDGYDDGYISMNAIKDIWGGNYIHPARLRIYDHIWITQSE